MLMVFVPWMLGTFKVVDTLLKPGARIHESPSAQPAPLPAVLPASAPVPEVPLQPLAKPPVEQAPTALAPHLSPRSTATHSPALSAHAALTHFHTKEHKEHLQVKHQMHASSSTPSAAEKFDRLKNLRSDQD